MGAVEQVLDELAGLAVETQPQKVKRRSRDFYWYSPILKRRLDQVTADAVVTPQGEAEVVRTVAACYRHRVPVTVRGGGTGNYGQAMPLEGGIVLDLSEMTAIRAIGHGRVRAQAGIKLADLDAATIADSRQELRLHPSTHKTGTLGGYVAGGSSGIGSITWGLLRDRGNILAARVVTMEARAAASSSCAAPTSRRSTTPTAPMASSPSSRCRWPLPIAGPSCWWRCRT